MCLVGAAVTNAVGGGLAERMGTERLLAVSLAGWAAVLVLAAVAPVGALFVLVPLVVTTGGLVDVVMNVASAAAYADRPGGLVRFHALFNVGAAIGAGAMGLMLAAGLRWRWMWAVVAALALLVVPWTAKSPMPVGERGESVRLGGTVATLRREGLVLIAVAFALGAMVEAGVELWGVIFLRTAPPSGLALGATSAVLGYAVAATARAVLGPRAGRRGAEMGVAIGAGLAGCGLLLLAAAPNRYLAGLGFVMGAGGISMCWPLLLASAAADRQRPGPVIGAVTAVGYLGFVLGPTVLGWVAELTSVRAGLVVLAAATVVVAVLPAASARNIGHS